MKAMIMNRPGAPEVLEYADIETPRLTSLLRLPILALMPLLQLLLLLGTFMDLAPMLLICTPILLPVVAKFGVDPIHFGMIMILNLGIGLIISGLVITLAVLLLNIIARVFLRERKHA